MAKWAKCGELGRTSRGPAIDVFRCQPTGRGRWLLLSFADVRKLNIVSN